MEPENDLSLAIRLLAVVLAVPPRTGAHALIARLSHQFTKISSQLGFEGRDPDWRSAAGGLEGGQLLSRRVDPIEAPRFHYPSRLANVVDEQRPTPAPT